MKTFFLNSNQSTFLLWKKINFLSLQVVIKLRTVLLPPPHFILFVLLFFVTNLKAQPVGTCASIRNFTIGGSSTSYPVIQGCEVMKLEFDVCSGSIVPVPNVQIKVTVPFFIDVLDPGVFHLSAITPDSTTYSLDTSLTILLNTLSDSCQHYEMIIKSGFMPASINKRFAWVEVVVPPNSIG
ncbi:MAG: hypothetical protein RLZZ292_3370, partial [Bacteroidota bacterium]